jgi:hypothetical protein
VASPKTDSPAPTSDVSKKLVVKRTSPQFSFYKIVYEGGGEAPDALKGNWTSPTMAQKAIDLYLKHKG